MVTLSGGADAGSKAVVWTGCDSIVGANECQVTLSADKTVTANFDLVPGQKLLKLKKAGNGTGTVTSAPAGIECNTACASDEAGFAENTSVTLSAVSGANSKTVAWSGCDEVTAGACKVTMSAAKEVTATFAAETRQLKVNKAGTGTGTVTSSPAGINCGATCTFGFDHGVTVTLTAMPGLAPKPRLDGLCRSRPATSAR